MQRALIPEGVSLSFKDIALGRARKTSGQGIPFFVGACCLGVVKHAGLQLLLMWHAMSW